MMLGLISQDEEHAFRQDGFLILRSAISPAEVQSLLNEVCALVRLANQNGSALHEIYYHQNSYRLIRILELSDKFDTLIDHPTYFGKLVSLIGTHIQLMGTEIFVRGAAHQNITGFHTDLGPGLNQLLPDDENPFLQIKVQIFLTDVSARDSGNFVLFPCSHRKRIAKPNELCSIDELNRQIGPDGELPSGSVQILANPGDVLLFPHTLWHAVGPNRSGRTRYSITLRYGQLALRPLESFDFALTDPGRKLTARQRRVLGDLGTEAPSPYRPLHQDEIIYAQQPFRASAPR